MGNAKKKHSALMQKIADKAQEDRRARLSRFEPKKAKEFFDKCLKYIEGAARRGEKNTDVEIYSERNRDWRENYLGLADEVKRRISKEGYTVEIKSTYEEWGHRGNGCQSNCYLGLSISW